MGRNHVLYPAELPGLFPRHQFIQDASSNRIDAGNQEYRYHPELMPIKDGKDSIGQINIAGCFHEKGTRNDDNQRKTPQGKH